MIEVLGYVASLFTVLSFLMKDFVRLRIMNVIACIMFIIYGCLIFSVPIMLVNSLVATINIFYIFNFNKKLIKWKKENRWGM